MGKEGKGRGDRQNRERKRKKEDCGTAIGWRLRRLGIP